MDKHFRSAFITAAFLASTLAVSAAQDESDSTGADRAREARAEAVQACKAAMWGRPVSPSGGWGELLANVALCDIDPRAALEKAQQVSAPPPASPNAGAFYVGERISGLNKICLYNHLGSAVATTIASTAICPGILP
jgi:hypothetical protein